MQKQGNNILSEIIDNIITFRDERDWSQFHDPKNLAEAINIEASELLEIFLWKTTDESYYLDEKKIRNLKSELADIFIFMTYLCDHYKIDIIEAVKEKIVKNSIKYPVSKAKGTSKKYNELE